MIIDIALIVVIVITGIVAGIVIGALYMVLSIMWYMRKAKRDYKQGKRLFEIKETPKEEVPKKEEPELEVPKPQPTPVKKPKLKQKKNIFQRIFKKK